MSAEDVTSLLEAGNVALRGGQIEEAIRIYTAGISRCSEAGSQEELNLVSMLANRSAAYLQSIDKHAEALCDAELVLRLRPDWDKGYLRKGCALRLAGRLDEAKSCYEEGLRRVSDTSAVQLELNKVEKEIQESNRGIIMEKLKEQGKAAYNEGHFEKAISFWTQCIEMDPASDGLATLLSNRSAAYLLMKPPKAVLALKDAERCVELRPQWPKGWSRLGAALQFLGRYDDAIAAYDDAPPDARLREERAKVIKKKEKMEEKSRYHSETIRNKAGATKYEVLGVTPDANQAQIRKAYFLLAKQYHPDKNPNDERASEKFQQISEAYEILGDPETRARYDKYGDVNMACGNKIDPVTMFSMIFGSAKFEDFIGTTEMASRIIHTRADGTPPTKATMEAVQRDRVSFLSRKLETFLLDSGGSKAILIERAQRLAASLALLNFGEAILHTIGYIYERSAQTALDATIPVIGLIAHTGEMIRKNLHSVRIQLEATDAAYKLIDEEKQLQELFQRGQIDEIERMLSSEKKGILSTLWKVWRKIENEKI